MEQWQRPKTTRMYLHPPMSESFYTLWREGKLIFGEALPAIGVEYFGIISSGLLFVQNKAQSFDFHSAKYVVREDGIPVHGLVNKLGNLDMEIESFATPNKKSTCYIKLIFKNNTERAQTEQFGFILRTAKECDLVFSAPDVYAPYSTNLEVWKNMPNTWRQKDGIFTDSARVLKMQSDVEFDFDEKTGMALTDLNLSCGSSCEIIFAYGIEEGKPLSFDADKQIALEFWEKELARIDKLPQTIKDNHDKLRLIKNLTVQLLQCFCIPKGADMVFARQGGLQRQIWTYESMSVLEALSRIGNFDDYIEPIIELYFKVFQTETGEIVPMGIHWGMATGNVLYSFARYAAVRGKDFYNKYRIQALKSFEWIINKRKSVKEDKLIVAGLFPPMRSCDDPLVFQSWTNSDAFNVLGIMELLKTAELFSDLRADEIKIELNAYRNVLIDEWKKISLKNKDSDKICFPFSPRISNDIISEKYEFNVCAAPIIDIVEASDEDVGKILHYLSDKNVSKDGLYDRMPDKNDGDSVRFNLDENGKCMVWYVCNHEYYWFKHFMTCGKFKQAEEILNANEKYAMTDEFYMLERYHMRNPWFAPWMPNASANGRTILMLCDNALT